MRIDHFHFLCSDPEKSVRFFVRHLEGEHYETAQLPNWRILRVRIGDIVLAFSPQRGPVAEPVRAPGRGFDHIGITVSDLDRLLREMCEDGGEIVKEPSVTDAGMRTAMVRVSDAIIIELLQPLITRKAYL